jgi:hypothetical protein
MNLSGDTMTMDNTRVIFHALMTAAEKSRRIMRLAEDSDINPHGAARALNTILGNLQFALAEAIEPAPPVPASLAADLVKAGPAG